MKNNISLEEAQSLLFEYCNVVESTKLDLADTLESVLSEDIYSQENIPPFARSPYDGYVLRAEDTVEASPAKPVTLEVIEEVPAGYTAKQPVRPGQAIKILTGAPIPEGADAVTKFEEVAVRDNTITITRQYKPGEDIVPAGEDIAAGQIMATKGTLITPPLMGVMASLGVAHVPVYKIPKVALISTGDELIDASEDLRPGKIRNSNIYTLQGYLRTIGIKPIVIGMCKDTMEAVADLVEKGWEEADVVITTGGVSVGDYDVIRFAADYLGAETLFWKIDIKPGSACLVAVREGKILIGLSGNPAAAIVTYQLLVVPFLKRMAGRNAYHNETLVATMQADFRKGSPRRRFIRGRIVFENGLANIETTGEQGNGVLSSLLGCDALAEVPEKSGPVKAGEKLTVYKVE
ncbi:molybdopterin molybdotransferase MoeA [Dehalobacter sp. DCM]|uniref:molybdopterin molybdotransferase MoeA n=1 Tax=Dehalobacter sp. DCM TaxID=2907827 RepID=UPI0030813588|nr:molybdopterin molybdotransferase MoeA [Dehalobacter sp. DCM]